jgi:hypothetical protein
MCATDVARLRIAQYALDERAGIAFIERRVSGTWRTFGQPFDHLRPHRRVGGRGAGSDELFGQLVIVVRGVVSRCRHVDR